MGKIADCFDSAADVFIQARIDAVQGNSSNYLIRQKNINERGSNFVTIMCKYAPWQYHSDMTVYNPYNDTRPWNLADAKNFRQYREDRLAMKEWILENNGTTRWPAQAEPFGRYRCGNYNKNGTKGIRWRTYNELTVKCPKFDDKGEGVNFVESERQKALVDCNCSNGVAQRSASCPTNEDLCQTCNDGYELKGNKCESTVPAVVCDKADHKYDPRTKTCRICIMQTICPTNYLVSQPKSCFGGSANADGCIDLCRIGYDPRTYGGRSPLMTQLYEFTVDNNGKYSLSDAPDIIRGSSDGIFYGSQGKLARIPQEMWSTPDAPAYFSRTEYGRWETNPFHYWIDGPNHTGKVWAYRLVYTRCNRCNPASLYTYNTPLLADLAADGWEVVPDLPEGPIHLTSGDGGDFTAYKKLIDVDHIMELTMVMHSKTHWLGIMIFKMACGE